MNNNKLKTVEISALLLSAIVTVAAMLYSANWSVDLTWFLFIIWAVSPYICVFLAGHLAEKIKSIPQTSVVFCVAAVLMLAFTLLTYLGAFFDQSSTYALVFLFIPVYLFIGSFFLIGIGLLFAIFFRRPAKKQV